MTEVYHITSKVCRRCQADKALIEFSRESQSPDGRRTRCKNCEKLGRDERKLLPPKPLVQMLLPFLKVCTGCNKEKSIDDFNIGPKYRDNRRSKCKECLSKREERRRQKPGYNEHKMQWHKAAYATRPKMAEKEREKQRNWNKNNPLKRQEQSIRRTVYRSKACIGKVSYKHILERDGYFCYICERSIDPIIKGENPGKLVFDHVVPLRPRQGQPQGTHSNDNIHPAHKVCNNRKYNKRLEDLTPFDRRGLSTL